MAREYGQDWAVAMPPMFPLQQIGCMWLDSVEQLADLQIDVARSYSRYAFSQLRDALEVRDPQSLQRYLEKQSQAAEELTRRISEDAERALRMGQTLSQRGMRLVQRGGEVAAAGVREGFAQELHRHTGPSEQRQAATDASQLAIPNYDELNVDDIQQQLDKLSKEQIRQLSEYERRNKNRKVLNEAFQRRL